MLDAPELLERLLTVRTMLVPSEALFFYVLVRQALRRARVDDRELADYLAAMLLEFGQRDRAWRVDWNDDQRHRYLVDILADLEATDGDRRFKVMVHLGNYALWLTGLFPDYIAARCLRKAGPDVGYYDAMGRRGFGMASDHALAEEYGLGAVLRTAAERFSLAPKCAQRRERPGPLSVSASPTACCGTAGFTDPRPAPPARGTIRAPVPGPPRASPPDATAPRAARALRRPVSTASINPSSVQPLASSPGARSRTA